MRNCIFCKIIEGKLPAAVVYEDYDTVAILDAFPSSIGHILVMPRNHVKDITKLHPDQVGRLFKIAAVLAKAIAGFDSVEGINILQNNGEAAGQTVSHFHIHIIPRYKGDGVTISWKTNKYDDDAIKKMRERISSAVASSRENQR